MYIIAIPTEIVRNNSNATSATVPYPDCTNGVPITSGHTTAHRSIVSITVPEGSSNISPWNPTNLRISALAPSMKPLIISSINPMFRPSCISNILQSRPQQKRIYIQYNISSLSLLQANYFLLYLVGVSRLLYMTIRRISYLIHNYKQPLSEE